MEFHPRQYLISSRELDVDGTSLITNSVGPFFSASSPLLEVTQVSTDASTVLLYGFIIDPLTPNASTRDVVQGVAESSDTTEHLFRNLQRLAGRFALFFWTDREFVGVGDACGARQIFYRWSDSGFVITSSLALYWRLFNEQLRVSDEKRRILSSAEYEASERAWFGSGTPDDRFGRLLPNHYLDLNKGSVARIPVDVSQLPSEQETVEYASSVLEGAVKSLLRRFRIVLPLTAGWDSRSLLAACRRFRSQVECFVFVTKGKSEESPDVFIPLRLSDRLNLRFRVVRPGPVRQDFLADCQELHVVPSSSRVAQIQYLYDEFGKGRSVRISGLASGVLKSSFYGYSRGQTTADMLYSFSGYYGKSDYVRDQISEWVRGAAGFCEEHSIPLEDLFYWEQRLAGWGAAYAFEQDIAMEELWPHGIRNLLLAGLRIDPAQRSRPNCHFHRQLIESLWQAALGEPCNPLSLFGEVFWHLRNNSRARYYKLKLFGGG